MDKKHTSFFCGGGTPLEKPKDEKHSTHRFCGVPRPFETTPSKKCSLGPGLPGRFAPPALPAAPGQRGLEGFDGRMPRARGTAGRYPRFGVGVKETTEKQFRLSGFLGGRGPNPKREVGNQKENTFAVFFFFCGGGRVGCFNKIKPLLELQNRGEI